MIDVSDSIFMRSLQRKPVPYTPVWIMRQAGRYLPEYRKTRAQAGDFLTLCKTPELACEVTLQPLRRFSLDAAILFSDILTIPDAFGLGLYFSEGEGPRFTKALSRFSDVDALSASIGEDLRYVFDAAALIRKEMPPHLPLIGFSGSPWTLACYMVEGGSSRDFKRVLHWLYTEPSMLTLLLNKLTSAVCDYLEEQIRAGVDVLMLFDTWGGVLTTASYSKFSLQYCRQIVEKLQSKYPDIPIILFTKGGGQWLQQQAAIGCSALGLDWTCDLSAARHLLGDKVALQGNLDPAVLRASPARIQQEVKLVLESFGQGSGHIFNLGHGITPDIPPEHVEALVEAVHELSPAYHTL